jgi:hypothetical protein
MKTVIFEEQSKCVVDIKNVNSSKYYGFIIGDNSPGYIASDNIMARPSFKPKFFDCMTEGNNWYSEGTDTIQQCLKMLNAEGNVKIYEFDTYQELLAWGSRQ